MHDEEVRRVLLSRLVWCFRMVQHGRLRTLGDRKRYRKARQKAARKRAVARRRAYVDSVLDVPCTDCSVFYGHALMEFDHVPERGEKLFSPTDARHTLTQIKAEIAKCDVVCCPCHHRREVARGRSHHSGKPCGRSRRAS